MTLFRRSWQGAVRRPGETLVGRAALQLCPFVKTGRMHEQFQRYLRPNGLGIDYANLLDFEIRNFLPNGGTDASLNQKRG